jgi:uncharacterized protein with HEPN domain
MRQEDDIRLRHMLDAVREALSFAEGKNRGELDDNRMLVLAILKDMEILGEAANKVSPETREKHPNIPWKDIIATRNRLIHGYFDINNDTIWQTLKQDLPNLKKHLEEILSPE